MADLIIPAMLDPHVHLRDLDWSHKATFASETTAALAGGYWAVFDMPNTSPATVDREALRVKLDSIGRQAVCDWGVYFGAGQVADAALYHSIVREVCGMKIYNNSTTGDLLIEDQSLREEHYRAWPTTRPIAVHAEGETVRDILALVRQYRKQTHFCHICTAEEIRDLEAAKEEGLPISIGVTPHHLYLTEDDIPTLGTLGLMKPTLKTRADRDAMWDALARGVVDIVESDHAPHTLAEKQSDKPPFGVPGLETTLPLMLKAVDEGRLTIEQVVALVADNPRRLWNLNAPPQTYVVVDPTARYTLEREDLRGACGWSPFEGMELVGKVKAVWIRGRKVYDGDQVLVEPGYGQNIFGRA